MNKIEALRREADMREMVEGTGLEWWQCVKYKEGLCARDIDLSLWAVPFEFALAIVEGKPVFTGDKLWLDGERKISLRDTTYSFGANGATLGNPSGGGLLSRCSFDPPKPETVPVELTREDAERWFDIGIGAKTFCYAPRSDHDKMTFRFYEAIEKALK